MKKSKSVCQNFAQCNKAMALIEFGLTLPVLMIILWGVIEVTRLVLIHQKLDKVVHALGDFSTQGRDACIGTDQLNVFAEAANQIFAPFKFEGSIVFTSATAALTPQPPCFVANQPCISWQYSPSDFDGSRIGTPGSAPKMPGDMVVNNGQNAIVVELFYPYKPIFSFTPIFVKAIGEQEIYRVSVYKPRAGSVTQLQAGSCPAT